MFSMPNNPRLLPEWVEQEAIILAWPDSETDWAPWLTDVRQCYINLIQHITANGTGVLLLIRETEVEGFLSQAESLTKVLLIPGDYNDTWVRDYAFLTCRTTEGLMPVEYTFNGWGNKFDASKDNQVNQRFLAMLCQHNLISYPLVCEGGALEIDQHGQLLSTRLCLTNPQRNGNHSIQAYRSNFQQQLGASKVTIFEEGHLEGDDTDGHIDTLVRFTPEQGLVVQSCQDPQDQHYQGLKALTDECAAAFPDHHIFELPLPKIYNESSERLPASYANFLINNQQVICPVYGQPEDEAALQVLSSAFPNHQIIPLDSRPLIEQFGSIHCISMQVPRGTLNPDIIDLFAQGVSVYGRR